MFSQFLYKRLLACLVFQMLLVSAGMSQQASRVDYAPPALFLDAAWNEHMGLHYQAARILSEYVQVESVSGNEKQAGEFFAGLARDLGLYVEVLTDERDSYNLIASLYPLDTGKPNIILLNHIDVVPAGDVDAWTYPPFSGQVSQGYVWGRGAIDNKGMAVMQLLALAGFVPYALEMDLDYNVSLLAVSGEETGGEKGAQLVVEEFLERLNPTVVYGEGGTGLAGLVQRRPEKVLFGISVAQKRGLWFEFRTTGSGAGHGSVPLSSYPPKDMVEAAGEILDMKHRVQLSPPVREMIRQIGKQEGGLRGFFMRNVGVFRPLMGGMVRRDPLLNALMTNTITLTNINGIEGAHNQVTSEVWATFDARLLPETDVIEFIGRLENIIGDREVSMQVVSMSPDGGVTEKGKYYHALTGALDEVFEDFFVSSILFPAHNDNIFFRMHGIPAYGLLPAVMSQELVESIHHVDERMPVSQLVKGVQAYATLIRLLNGL